MYRKILCGSVLALLAGVIMLSDTSPANALVGCCKVRDSSNSSWVATNKSLRKCKAQNASSDKGDNILKPMGNVWWDINC